MLGFPGFFLCSVKNELLPLYKLINICWPLQVGTSGWTTSQGLEAGSCFPRCTWKRAEVHCPAWRRWWSCRPITSGRAATGKRTLRSLCKNSVVCRAREKNCSSTKEHKRWTVEKKLFEMPYWNSKALFKSRGLWECKGIIMRGETFI